MSCFFNIKLDVSFLVKIYEGMMRSLSSIFFLRFLVLITCFRKYYIHLFGLFSSSGLVAGELVKQPSIWGFIFIPECIMIFYT